MDNFSDMLTFEGAGRRRNDTRSTSMIPLKTWGYNTSNYIAMWKVGGIKIERTRARNFFLQMDKEISEKRKFFVNRSVT